MTHNLAVGRKCLSGASLIFSLKSCFVLKFGDVNLLDIIQVKDDLSRLKCENKNYSSDS